MKLKKTNGLGKVLLPVAAVATGLVLWMSPQVSAQQGGSGQPSTKNFEWPMYTADLAGSKYTPAAQLDNSNFGKLEVAWRFKTDAFGTRPEYKLEGTPIMVLPMIIGELLHSSPVSLSIQMRAHPIGTVPPDRQLGKSPALHSVNIVWRLPA